MGKIEIKKGDMLHASGETVETAEIVLKGSIRISDSASSITIGNGAIAGAAERPGGSYMFDYDVLEDSVLYSYPYENPDDICSLVKVNPQLCSILSASMIKAASDTYISVRNLCEDTDSYYQELLHMNDGYRELCSQAGEIYRPVNVFNNLQPPVMPDLIEWKHDYFAAVSSEKMPDSIDYCTGMIMLAIEYIRYLTIQLDEISDYRINLNEETAEFRMNVHNCKTRIADIRRAAEETRLKFASAGASASADTANTVEIRNALGTILGYSGISTADADHFRKLISALRSMSDRTDTSDSARQLRREISADFYRIYEKAFFKSMSDKEIPVELKMFFYFGFVDEELAGKRYTSELAALAENLRSDPDGRVVTIYEWLSMIYKRKVEPSKNEFDMEYPAYLKSRYQNGDISASEMNALLEDNKERVSFEIKNLFTMANRMTFGRISSFVPVFCDDEQIKTPSDSILTYDNVNRLIDKIRSIDFSCFFRETIFSDTKIGITREFVQKEVLPYVILMPNSGTRSALWQETSSAHRDTPARMLVPIFPAKEPELYFMSLAGEFRWEICRKEQGVHWNDVTVPSLTSEYSDYIQFYRKNHDLSAENKEKIKSSLQSARNSTKNVFIADYISYVQYESNGSSRLNKTARGILFKYCPFPLKMRSALALSSPAYSDLVERYKIKQAQKLRLMDIVLQKITKGGFEIPEEITCQYDFIKK